jgi:hypothetical protein
MVSMGNWFKKMNIDPILLVQNAQNFAALVGLLCNFQQERGSQKASSHQEFIEWLQHHRHEELKNLIINNHQLPRAVDDLLQKDQQEILHQIQNLNEIFATVLSRINGFSGLVMALAPGFQLSDQAKGFLTEFADSNFQLLIFWPQTGTIKLANRIGEFGQKLKAVEPTLVEDDFKTLTRLGFFESDNKGDCLSFKLTRAGANYRRASN